MPNDSERALAIFVDFDNIAQGFRRTDRFDIQRVLKRMVEKGKIVAKKTYADWSRYLPYTAALHEAAFELVEIPKRSMTGKNSADIRLCVDAMDLAYNKTHIDTFVIVSGDSDFTPLVSKLKEMGKHVIGLGMTNSTSDLLRDNCDEFIYYEDLEVEKTETPRVNLPVPDTKRKALELLLEACTALRRENKEVLWASMIKETMKRKKPSFNETYHGFNTFSELLEDAQGQGLVELERDQKRGTYTVVRFGTELSGQVRKETVREQPRTRTRDTGSVSKRPQLTTTPHKRQPLPVPVKPERPARPEHLERLERALEPERATPAPAPTRFVEPELKPRETRFQGFSDFEQETTQFLGKRAVPNFEEEFADFGLTSRNTLESTAEEVMAGIASDARTVSKSKEPVVDVEPVVSPPARVEEAEDKDQFKKRRRRGRGKERGTGDEPAAPESVSHATDAPKAAELPISFDDVPFSAVSDEPAESMPTFRQWSPEEVKPEPQAPPPPQPVVHAAPKYVEPEPVAQEAPKRSGFGFGIFDE